MSFPASRTGATSFTNSKMEFFYDSAASASSPNRSDAPPFQPFAMDVDVSHVDAFLPEFMFASGPFSTTSELSAKIVELSDEADMTPQIPTDILSDPEMTANVQDTQIYGPVDWNEHSRKKPITDKPQDHRFKIRRRSAPFSNPPDNDLEVEDRIKMVKP